MKKTSMKTTFQRIKYGMEARMKIHEDINGFDKYIHSTLNLKSRKKQSPLLAQLALLFDPPLTVSSPPTLLRLHHRPSHLLRSTLFHDSQQGLKLAQPPKHRTDKLECRRSNPRTGSLIKQNLCSAWRKKVMIQLL